MAASSALRLFIWPRDFFVLHSTQSPNDIALDDGGALVIERSKVIPDT